MAQTISDIEYNILKYFWANPKGQAIKQTEEYKKMIPIYSKRFREKNREEYLDYQKEYRKKNKEVLWVGLKEYREKNKEKISIKNKKHYEANKE